MPVSMTLISPPHRRREPRRSLGIPTIPAGRSDGGTADVSTVDTELLTCSTPRGLARPWRWVRALSPDPTPRQRQPQIRVNPRERGADTREADTSPGREPLPPHTRG
ncbi:hypothetical protein BKH31_05195 [Actinomyces oris]|uniref:Uncharacterized protein n=1 Tax=Actinomyces oris TaxID=544580 RepID=A0A1Q8VGF7_9ACTO|nr:hypothetical protein BKH31_05195 [Actinomyces oris]